MSPLALYLFGAPRLERDGEPVHLLRRKMVALLAYLAVTGRIHRRDALATLLWPEYDQSSALAYLRRILSMLNRTLGEGWLAVDRESAGLDPDADLWLDVEAFRQRLAACQEHGHRGTEVCPQCVPLLKEAVELYGDDFMAGFTLRDSPAFDEFQFFETQGLRDELAGALERLVRYYGSGEDDERAIACARRWLALDPMHEPVHRHLMQLYAQAGQRAAALRQYDECARILGTELGLPPSRASTSLYEQIRAHPDDQALPLPFAAPPPHNLPAQITPFIGREAELAQIGERLADPACRLLTLVGPGGIGKTRLALEAAGEQLGRFGDGVYLVSLAAVPSINAVPSTVAQALDLAFHQGSDPWRRVLDHLRHKQVILVLDNVEHLADSPHPTGRGAGDLVNEILRAAPEVKILITSRTRLNVQGEHLLPVSGMDYPELDPRKRGETGDAPGAVEQHTGQYGAVRLFLSTARRVCPDFAPTASSVMDVGRICALVQGMPLAILMAAAWMEVLSPPEIAAELRRGYDLLEADLRDLPDRQRSIERVFDASWGMLDDAEREAFARLSVFRGGFAREAAENVAVASLRTLVSLAHKSFVQRAPGGRYQIHELLRQYGERRLAEDPEERKRTHGLHAAYYARLLEHGQSKVGSRLGVWPALLAEMDNLRAGWEWAIGQAELALIRRYTALVQIYWAQGRQQELKQALEWAAGVLRVRCGGRIEGQLGIALGIVLGWLGGSDGMIGNVEPAEAQRQTLQESLSILRRLGARRELALFAETAGYLHGPEDETQSQALLHESLALLRELDDPVQLSETLSALGELAVQQGAYAEAERYCAEALEIGQQIGDVAETGYALGTLGKIAYYRGEYQEARRLFQESLALFEQINRTWCRGSLCSLLGDTAMAARDDAEARERHQQARALYQEMDIPWGRAFSGEYWGLAYSLDRLGDIALAIGDRGEAEGFYRQALSIAGEHPYVALKLDVVVSHAALLARSGQEERAVELAALALHHPASDGEVAARAQSVLDELEGELPPIALAAAQGRGRSRDLDATVQGLLAGLER